jgi:hypothetical protein
MLELLMSEWEERLEQAEYEPVHDALRAGIKLLEKYYRRADDTDVYFIAHGMMHAAMSSAMSHICLVLDPVLKLGYLEAAWDQEYLDKGMECFKSQVGLITQLPFLWSNFSAVSCLQKKIRGFPISEERFAECISTRAGCVDFLLIILGNLTPIFSSVLNGRLDGEPYQEKAGEEGEVVAVIIAGCGG